MTENATDIEDIPRDQIPIIKSTAPNPIKEEETTGSKEFMENLMKDFDTNSSTVKGSNESNAETVEAFGDDDNEDIDEDDESRSVYPTEKRMSRANSEKAIQIIKENSEILDKILRKKGERLATPEDQEEDLAGPPLNAQAPVNLVSRPSVDSSGTRPSLTSNRSNRQSIDSTVSSNMSSHCSGSSKVIVPNNGVTKPITFNPFPTKPAIRRKRDVGRKLGLYSAS